MARLYAEIFDLATALRSAPTVPDLNNAFRHIVQRLGPYAYALGEVHKTHAGERHLVSTTYPRHWAEHYRDQRYDRVDPTIDPAHFWRTPYDWRQLRRAEIPAQRRMFAEFSDLGFKGGYSIPLPSSPASLFLIGVASQEPAISAKDKTALVLAFSQYHHRYHEIASPRPAADAPSLTERERECLLWVAQGKDTQDIGTILNISENTVKFHLRNAMAKLDCHNRVQTVVRAICHGLIQP
ncbi:helix-turn-helix transcriptional regulator [Gluconacetobacter sacchari]|uniref:LuxR family transcriptional regulator n=2 Tax=Gluconacetobacter sacchari TaxID=92759 RepID=A0A7W4IGV8_9PROT|nr:LuxR C-terminal-related transcriptional regulator [Gluconacetobacter sacchari]MBB2162610.1 LuxR family transcriptional regulator [Gluconacetobacter sacchari]GBQ22713.1 N-acylhomoserine lactone-dependent regulatory protein [Gluconacetobacter sacchari DSM 12717]